MPFKLALSTNAFTKFTLRQALEKIKKLGFEGVEILADTPHVHFKYDTLKIKLWLKKYKLAVSNINANTCRLLKQSLDGFYPSIISQRRKHREKRIKHIKSCILLARDTGCGCISITTGKKETRDAKKILKTVLQELLEYAYQNSVKIGIEYEPGLYIGDSKSLERLIKDMQHPALGVNLDIGHAVVAGEDLEKVLNRFADRIWNIHIEDIKGRTHFHLIPGFGDIDFLKVRRLLKRIGYEGFLTVELYTYSNNPEKAGRLAFEYLTKIFY
jgi:sugar phosphate isomerase/epimerase